MLPENSVFLSQVDEITPLEMSESGSRLLNFTDLLKNELGCNLETELLQGKAFYSDARADTEDEKRKTYI